MLLRWGAVSASALIAAGALAPAAWAENTQRVSVGQGGVQANEMSTFPAISAGGRWVAFQSTADNLVPGDTNGVPDVFVRDRLTGTTERVSVAAGGRQANGESREPVISAGGQLVAFISVASNLVAGDTNDVADVFVRDRATGATLRVSVGQGGVQANETSFEPAMSPNGRFVVFTSYASNLVAGDTDGTKDVFLRDRRTGTTERVSIATSGAQPDMECNSPAVSADGRYVVFWSQASTLVPGDSNGMGKVFLRDRQTGRTERVSVSSRGVQANSVSTNATISADGRYVAFESSATNLVPGDTNRSTDVFVRDRVLGTTTRVSVATGGAQAASDSSFATISADGRYVAFSSWDTGLAPGATNGTAAVFVRDFVARTTRRVSLAANGASANDVSGTERLAISPHGQLVAFRSLATNLVPGDTNGTWDVFVRNLTTAR